MYLNFSKISFQFTVFIVFLAVVNPLSAQWKEEHPMGRKVSEVFRHIDKMYVDSVDYEGISDAAIVAMLEELDPHSTYIPADEVKSANERIDGSFVGVGIRFQILKDTLIVISCVPTGPAEKVGVMAGDKIIKVGEENIAGVGLKNSDVRKKLLGEMGTRVTITVERKRTEKPIDFTITRDKIPVHSVISSYMVDDKVGYIKLTNFSRTTAQEVKETIVQLKKEGMKDLIFDLQGNTGGLLFAAKYVCDEFLGNDKLIVYSEGRSQPRAELKADGNGNFEKGRLVVLIDEGSASASEIVAGAIQDWDRGLVVGRRSFGKGLVQRPINLSDGSQIRLTIARYFTPSGRFIQKPYDDLDSYRKDYYERYKGGELTHKDSVKINEDLKFETKLKKRTVYGGGGIMPDEFVPLDTSEYSDYYRKLSRSGLINSFAVNYVNDNRESLKEKYKSLEVFKNTFYPDDAFMETFFEYVIKEDTAMQVVEEDYEISKSILQVRIKALIAQNIWDYSAYFQIINPKNEIFLSGYELLKSNNYNKRNLKM